MKYVIGKLTPEIIDDELLTNIMIETDIVPNYTAKYRGVKGNNFKIRQVDRENQSAVNLNNLKPVLFEPALKFIKYHDIRVVDFTSL